MTRNTVIHLHRSTELPDEWYADNCPVDYDRNPRFDGPARHIVIGAMPSARAADASHSSLLRVSARGGIAIAALCAIYFALQLARAL